MIARKMATDELQFTLRGTAKNIQLHCMCHNIQNVGVQRQNNEDGISNEEDHLWEKYFSKHARRIARLHSR